VSTTGFLMQTMELLLLPWQATHRRKERARIKKLHFTNARRMVTTQMSVMRKTPSRQGTRKDLASSTKEE